MKGTDVVEEPYRFVCGACGRTARSRYGVDAAGNRTTDSTGYDESCAMNAVLCKRDEAGVWHSVEEPDNA